MNKAFFKDHVKKSMAEVEVDQAFKNELAQQLFSTPPPKKHFWTWPKAIFTAPVIAAIALTLILNSSKETVIFSQQALAQAIENTLNFNAFETTIGFADDGKFHHRKIISNVIGEIENSNNTIDLWSDGKNFRKDMDWNDYKKLNEDESFENNRLIISNLINRDEHFTCDFEPPFGANCKTYSESERKQLKKERENFFVADQGGIFSPVQDEHMINDVSFESFKSNSQVPAFYLNFATPTPIQNPYIGVVENDYTSVFSFGISQGDGEYLNKFENGIYQHQVMVSSSPMYPMYIDKPIFIQIQDITWPTNREGVNDAKIAKNASMIYAVNLKNASISAFSSKKFINEMPQNSNLLDSVTPSVQTAIYIMRYRDQFKNPTAVQQVIYHNQSVIKLSYPLPESYSEEIYNGFDPVQEKLEKAEYDIDIFMDIDQIHFLGCSVRRNGVEVQNFWIEDQILPASEKKNIFGKNQWEKLYKNTPTITPSKSEVKKDS